jgi:RNA polymerase primary sigma factor
LSWPFAFDENGARLLVGNKHIKVRNMQDDHLKTRRSRMIVPSEPTLGIEEETLLAEAVARGDAAARERLIVANVGLAAKIALQWEGRGMDRDDLIAEATCGLISAVDHFVPGLGARFGTYAAFWIKQSLRRAVEEAASMIVVPSTMVKLVQKWKRATRKLGDALGRAPSSEEIAESLGLSPPQAQRVMAAMTAGVKLASTITGKGTRLTVLDSVPDERETEPPPDRQGPDLREILHKRLDELTGRERLVLTLRYGLEGGYPRSLDEISAKMRISRHLVKLLQVGAEEKLRAPRPTRKRRGKTRPVPEGLSVLPPEHGALTGPVLERQEHRHVTGHAENHLGEVAGDLADVPAGSRTISAALKCNQAPHEKKEQDGHDLPNFTEHAAQTHKGSLSGDRTDPGRSAIAAK